MHGLCMLVGGFRNILYMHAEGSECLPVYEFSPKKNLDKILFRPQWSTELDWSKRLNIILGVVHGSPRFTVADHSSCGYVALEYFQGGQLSVKSDVYTFGGVILEIMCRTTNDNSRLLIDFQSLLEWEKLLLLEVLSRNQALEEYDLSEIELIKPSFAQFLVPSPLQASLHAILFGPRSLGQG
ncbi:putative cysteine-rich receptor-like protein kinase 33 [Cryptomeria japonica]|uniref:putative cysteine-rich receptor-like protein kinase 33 n=1 Tax=Cryptomeria japonica TaxID=3369 RepID=UPI0025AD729A|nr:putative cysteine-rich receptor-like protein kinase 33 [Cryptomeria japonica]